MAADEVEHFQARGKPAAIVPSSPWEIRVAIGSHPSAEWDRRSNNGTEAARSSLCRHGRACPGHPPPTASTPHRRSADGQDTAMTEGQRTWPPNPSLFATLPRRIPDAYGDAYPMHMGIHLP